MTARHAVVLIITLGPLIAAALWVIRDQIDRWLDRQMVAAWDCDEQAEEDAR